MNRSLNPTIPHAPIPWERIEALLHRVRKPGRYVGGEYNTVHKPWDETPLHVCLAFPDLYDLGMSNFALTILYDILNRRSDTLAERTYLPAPDMIAELRAQGVPLYALESYRPVAAFDLLGISAAYEQLFTNTLELLDLAGLPVRAAERDRRHPLVIGGGHGTFNPEPMTDFFDAFVIGDGEEILVEVVERLLVQRELPREEQLRTLLDIEGLYIPRFYRPVYTVDGSLERIEPTVPEAPRRVRKRVVSALPPTPVRQLVPNVEIVHERGVVEIQRGCTHGCRFCQAGVITRPVRQRPAEEIVEDVEAIAVATGYEEFALLSLSTADHTEIVPLMETLKVHFSGRHVGFSLPSLRIDAFSVNLADSLSESRRSGFTFAPEAATEALRARINKDVTTETLMEIAAEVFERGWRTLKLYFMIGLPGETLEDVVAIADMAHDMRRLARRVGGRKAEVHVSASTFIPKPHTVFQWEPMARENVIEERLGYLRKNVRGRGLRLGWNRYPISRIEGLLTRGDRRLNAVVEQAWRTGARFDAWDEWWHPEAWDEAIEEVGTALFGSGEALLDFFLYRPREENEVFPWHHLHSGVEKRFLLQDYRRSQRGEFLNDCREKCHGCGILANFPEICGDEWQCPVPGDREERQT
ncbi:MAG: TIGR03960 family B12-binding radical SAM protein [Anaerolineales bacterium]